MRSDCTIRTATDADVVSIAAIHLESFPKSGLSALGKRALCEYYRWQSKTTPRLAAAVAEDGGKIVGYCMTGGAFGSLSDFLRSHVSLVAWEALRNPSVLMDRRTFRIFPYLLRRFKKRFRSAHDKKRSAEMGSTTYGIHAIAVGSEARDKGVATALMNWAEQEGLRSGFRYAYLAVDTANEPAIRFYEGAGWERVTKGTFWNGHMKRDLLSGRPEARETENRLQLFP